MVLEIADPNVRDRIRGLLADLDYDSDLSPEDDPVAVIRCAATQESSGVFAPAPVICIADPNRYGGGCNPFLHAMVRHLADIELTAEDLAEMLTQVQTCSAMEISDEDFDWFYLDSPGERAAIQSEIIDLLVHANAPDALSSSLIEALVALTGGPTNDLKLEQPIRIGFRCSAAGATLYLASRSRLSFEALNDEFARGHRSHHGGGGPAGGWYAALRDASELVVNVARESGTEVVLRWRGDASPTRLRLHLCGNGFRGWRRARRHPVHWAARLYCVQRHDAIPVELLDVSAAGARFAGLGGAALSASSPVRLVLSRTELGDFDLGGIIRYANLTSRGAEGAAIEFDRPAASLGRALAELANPQ